LTLNLLLTLPLPLALILLRVPATRSASPARWSPGPRRTRRICSRQVQPKMSDSGGSDVPKARGSGTTWTERASLVAEW